MNKGKTIAVYYFSATGNSFKLSMDIASHLKDVELYRISNSNENTVYSDAEMIGFIFPVYMGGIPDIVKRFLQDFPYQKGVYYFSIATYYKYRGRAVSIVDKIMSEKGVSLSYANYLPSVGNCLKEYEVLLKQRTKILERSESLTTFILQDLEKQIMKPAAKYRRLSDRLHKKLFNAFFSPSRMNFVVGSNCIQCGICEKICPVNNIHVEEKGPVWERSCEACHACVHWCPQNAIHTGCSKGRLQYRNPSVTMKMLFNL